jgi:hypothetical protein
MRVHKTLWLLSSVLLLFGGASAEADGCRLTKGLFERWSELTAAGVSYPTESSGASSASKELESITEKYFQFMTRVSSTGGPEGGESECCTESAEDPVAQILCKFVRYLRSGGKDPRLFLESVPTTSTGRQALWALDPIAHFHAEHNPENMPALFKPYGPVTLYLDEFYRFVRLGDNQALSKYLELYPHADGEFAEQMDDQMEELIRSHLRLVLKEWNVFRLHRKAMLRFMAFLPRDEKEKLRSEVAENNECRVRAQACGELKSLLNINTPPIE